MTECFRILPNVCSVSDQDGTTILNIRGNRIYSLIGMGSIVWSKLAGSSKGLTLNELADDLSTEFNSVSRIQIEQDLTALLDSFRDRALVRSDIEHPTESRVRPTAFKAVVFTIHTILTALVALRLNAIAALFCLASITFVLRTSGFEALCKALKSWPISARFRKPRTELEISRAVERAALWYPRVALCLQRSAAVTVLLRECGIAGEMVIACRRVPFKAHAWVEVNGEVVNDNAKVQQVFRELARL